MRAIPRLFRYQPLSADLGRERELLLENRMYFPSPSAFNDPFEARPHLTFSRNARISRADALAIAARQASHLSRNKQKQIAWAMVKNSRDPAVSQEVIRQMRQAIQADFHATSIKCFCDQPDSLLQWAYYAGCHGGIRLEFSGINRWRFVDDTGETRPMALSKVRYSDVYPNIDADSDFDGGELMAALLTKSTEWVHEREWRALRIRTRPGHQEIGAGDVVSLVLGSRTPNDQADALLELCKQRKVPIQVYRAVLADNGFRVELADIGKFGGT
jgi:hypothetical protein